MRGSPDPALTGVLELDRLVHEPARLLILTVLSQVERVDFSFVELATGLTKGNLSSHLAKLEAGGLVRIDKRFKGKRPQTLLAITTAGGSALASYREQLAQFMAAAAVATKET